MNTNENQPHETPATTPTAETTAQTPMTAPATPTPATTPEQPKTEKAKTPKPKAKKATTKTSPKPKTPTKPKATKKTTSKAKKTKTKTTSRADRTPRIKEKAPAVPAKIVGLVKAAKTSREKRRILALGLALKGKVQIEVFRSACYHLKCYNSANFAQDLSKERDNGILMDSREKIKGKRARRVGFALTAKGRKLAKELIG